MTRIDTASLTVTQLLPFKDHEPVCWQAVVKCMHGKTLDTGTGVHGVIWTPGEVTASGSSYEDALVALGNTVAAMGAVA